MHPRFEELCDTLPAASARRCCGRATARRLLTPLIDRDRKVTTSRLGGFLLLWGLARLRRFRPGSLRYADEQAAIAAWLERAVDAARLDYDLAVEIVRLQRLVKGYGDTHANGLRNYRPDHGGGGGAAGPSRRG